MGLLNNKMSGRPCQLSLYTTFDFDSLVDVILSNVPFSHKLRRPEKAVSEGPCPSGIKQEGAKTLSDVTEERINKVTIQEGAGIHCKFALTDTYPLSTMTSEIFSDRGTVDTSFGKVRGDKNELVGYILQMLQLTMPAWPRWANTNASSIVRIACDPNDLLEFMAIVSVVQPSLSLYVC